MMKCSEGSAAARKYRMIETQPPSTNTAIAEPGCTVAAARIVRRLHETAEWQRIIDDVLELLARSLGAHRGILFRLRELPGEGFAQSIAAYWVDEEAVGNAGRPSIILQSIVNSDPLLARLAEEVRQGKMFAGRTREIEGYLRGDFENQKIKSFMSVTVFANGHLWGTLAINDCAVERRWTDEEKAAVEIVAMAIGAAIERSLSDAHVSEIIRQTMLQASLDAIIVIDETGSIIEFNPAAERIYGYKRADILGKDLIDTIIPHFYRKGYATGADYMAGTRRADDRPAHGDRHPERLRRDFSDRIDGDGDEGRRPPAFLRLDSRPQGQAARRGGDQPAAREAAPEREDGGDGLSARRRLARAQQPAGGRGGAIDAAARIRAGPADQASRRKGARRRRALRPHRQELPRHGAPASDGAGRNRLEQRRALRARGHGLRRAFERHQHRRRFRAGPIPVLADADHITQVAANFLINSQHALAAQNGERRITVRTFRLSDRTVGFSVEDTGPGIPVAIRHRIFDSYFTTKPVGVGTGIGLSISKAIVERHKGSIRFEEVTPNGARFVVELPAFVGAHTGVAAQEARSNELRNALIVDDEPDVAASLSDILELMGIKSRVVTAWGSAPAVLADFEPDIVFCDLRMPEASGITVYRELIAYRPDLARRFVLVTGDMVGARAEIGALSAHERPLVLEKPFSTLDVRSALAAVNDQTTLTH